MNERNNREVLIAGDSLFSNVQEAFTAFYPFLSIEFFQKQTGDSLPSHDKIESSTRIRKASNLISDALIDVNGERTVADVLADFVGALGVRARVCRKSGAVWNAISVTDGWTLDRQNAAGEYVSSIMK